MPISPVPELVAELAAGRMVILVDEEDRENEGDLILAADHVTPKRSTSWPSSAGA
jgi:3,4-dihydroxy 2-butanone 4-phosphate synthase/GTP cyclohydrolase II